MLNYRELLIKTETPLLPASMIRATADDRTPISLIPRRGWHSLELHCTPQCYQWEVNMEDEENLCCLRLQGKGNNKV